MHLSSIHGGALSPAGPATRHVRKTHRLRVCNSSNGKSWVGRKAEQADHTVHHAVDAMPTPPRPHAPSWMPSLPAMALGGAVVYGLMTTVFKKEGPPQQMQQEQRETQQHEKVQTPMQEEDRQREQHLADAVRKLLEVDSVESDTKKADQLFEAADADKDGRLSLKELMRVLYKVDASISLAAARDAAVDAFVLLHIDARKGMDQQAWYKFLQTYCLWTDSSFRELAPKLERAARAPDYLHRPEDKKVADDIDLAMRTPENTQRYVEGRKIETVFNLWDTDGDGKVSHYKLDRALCRLLAEMPREGERGKARIAAQQFLIKERVVGPAELSRVDFASLASRFSDLAGLPFQEVEDFLLVVALHNEFGIGPDPEDLDVPNNQQNGRGREGMPSGSVRSDPSRRGEPMRMGGPQGGSQGGSQGRGR